MEIDRERETHIPDQLSGRICNPNFDLLRNCIITRERSSWRRRWEVFINQIRTVFLYGITDTILTPLLNKRWTLEDLFNLWPISNYGPVQVLLDLLRLKYLNSKYLGKLLNNKYKFCFFRSFFSPMIWLKFQ